MSGGVQMSPTGVSVTASAGTVAQVAPNPTIAPQTGTMVTGRGTVSQPFPVSAATIAVAGAPQQPQPAGFMPGFAASSPSAASAAFAPPSYAAAVAVSGPALVVNMTGSPRASMPTGATGHRPTPSRDLLPGSLAPPPPPSFPAALPQQQQQVSLPGQTFTPSPIAAAAVAQPPLRAPPPPQYQQAPFPQPQYSQFLPSPMAAQTTSPLSPQYQQQQYPQPQTQYQTGSPQAAWTTTPTTATSADAPLIITTTTVRKRLAVNTKHKKQKNAQEEINRKVRWWRQPYVLLLHVALPIGHAVTRSAFLALVQNDNCFNTAFEEADGPVNYDGEPNYFQNGHALKLTIMTLLQISFYMFVSCFIAQTIHTMIDFCRRDKSKTYYQWLIGYLDHFDRQQSNMKCNYPRLQRAILFTPDAIWWTMTIWLLSISANILASKLGLASIVMTTLSLARVMGFEGAVLGRNCCMRCCCECCCCPCCQKCCCEGYDPETKYKKTGCFYCCVSFGTFIDFCGIAAIPFIIYFFSGLVATHNGRAFYAPKSDAYITYSVGIADLQCTFGAPAQTSVFGPNATTWTSSVLLPLSCPDQSPTTFNTGSLMFAATTTATNSGFLFWNPMVTWVDSTGITQIALLNQGDFEQTWSGGQPFTSTLLMQGCKALCVTSMSVTLQATSMTSSPTSPSAPRTPVSGFTLAVQIVDRGKCNSD